MKRLLTVLRWLLLAPAISLFVACYSLWFLNVFGREHSSRFWHLHFDLILFLASLIEAAMLCVICLDCAFLQKACRPFRGRSLGRAFDEYLELVVEAQGLTPQFTGEIAAKILGGAIAYLFLLIVYPAKAEAARKPSFG